MTNLYVNGDGQNRYHNQEEIDYSGEEGYEYEVQQ